MIRMFRFIRHAIWLCLALFSLDAAAWAQDSVAEQEIILVHGQRQNPFAVPSAAMAWKFKELLRQNSQGAIQVLIIPDGQAGDDSQSLRLIRGNVAQSAFVPAQSLVAVYPPIAATLVPFAIPDRSRANALYAGPFGQAMIKDMEDKTGLVILGLVAGDGSPVIANTLAPITGPDDLQGLRLLRPASDLDADMLEALGAKQVAIPRLETQNALETGLADGMVVCSDDLARHHYDDNLDFATLTNHVHPPLVWLFNRDVFDHLSSSQQAMIRQTATDAIEAGRKLAEWQERDLAGPRGLGRKMQVNTLTPDQYQSFARIVRSVMDKAVQDRHGELAVQWLQRLREAQDDGKR